MPFCEHQHYAASSCRIKAPASEATRLDIPTKAALRRRPAVFFFLPRPLGCGRGRAACGLRHSMPAGQNAPGVVAGSLPLVDLLGSEDGNPHAARVRVLKIFEITKITGRFVDNSRAGK